MMLSSQALQLDINKKEKEIMPDSNWNERGVALSDKPARKELGLTQDQIIDAIKCGKIQ